jgi:hypothetical protein
MVVACINALEPDSRSKGIAVFLTLVFDGDVWPNSWLGHFTPREEAYVPIKKEAEWSSEAVRTF